MLYKKTKILMVSEDDFYKEIETSDDVEFGNLNNSVRKKAKTADIVMYKANDITIILKNRYGGIGAVV